MTNKNTLQNNRVLLWVQGSNFLVVTSFEKGLLIYFMYGATINSQVDL